MQVCRKSLQIVHIGVWPRAAGQAGVARWRARILRSRGARRKPVDYGIEPTHVVANFGELRELLRESYDVPV